MEELLNNRMEVSDRIVGTAQVSYIAFTYMIITIYYLSIYIVNMRNKPTMKPVVTSLIISS